MIENEYKIETVPQVRAILIESTSNWIESIQKRAGRLFEPVIYDNKRAFHICSITTSAEIYYVMEDIYTKEFDSDDPEQQKAREALEDDIRSGFRDSNVDYTDMDNADSKPYLDFSEMSRELWEKSRSDYDNPESCYQAIMEAIVEHLRCNWPDWHSLIDAEPGKKV